MTAAAGWLGPVAVWVAVTLGGRGLLTALGLRRCRVGDWGTSFLLGFTLFTSLLYAGALVGAAVGAPLILAAAWVVVAGGLLAARRRRLPAPAPVRWSPAEWVLAGALAVLTLVIVQNALFFPVIALDARSYAGRALYILHDRSLNLALYHWPGSEGIADTNISYPPLMSLGYAVTYALGGWQPKILTLFFALAWPLVVYGVVRSHLSRFAAMAWTLILTLTPEVLAHTTFALLNLPAMALITGEAAALAGFLDTGRRRWLVPAGVLAAGAAGVRPDAIVVHAALGAAAVLTLILRRDRRVLVHALPPLLLVGLAPLLTWGSWTLYLATVVHVANLGPVARGATIGLPLVLGRLARFLVYWPTFGVTFILWLLTLPFVFTRAGTEARFFRLAVPLVFGALVVLFSLLDQGFGGGPTDVLNSSFKRALFYAVPLSGLAAALTPPWSRLAARGRGWVHLEPRGRAHAAD
jgi:hypothetical protein